MGLRLGVVRDRVPAPPPATATSLSASHTIPVTIAAEQGLIGELAYVALVLAAFVCLVRRARGDPVRAAIAAAFVALVFHTMLYADFLEDPVTWALLGIGVALAGAPPLVRTPTRGRGAQPLRRRRLLVCDRAVWAAPRPAAALGHPQQQIVQQQRARRR